MSPTSGWYADPLTRAELRWWDGTTWTADVRTGPAGGRDPLGADGTPLGPSPVWAPPPMTAMAGPPPPATPAAPAALPARAGVPRTAPTAVPPIGRGLVVGLVAVGVAFAVLIGGLVVAGVRVVDRLPAVVQQDVERQVARQMAPTVGAVTVRCPSLDLLTTGTHTIRCRATESSTGDTTDVLVVIRNNTVRSWRFADTPAPTS